MSAGAVFFAYIIVHFIYIAITTWDGFPEPIGIGREQDSANQYLFELRGGAVAEEAPNSDISMAAMWMNIDE